ncbi:MAG TPA: hypothetical protein ENI61_02630 [Ignavibacteria bacterium]|nr:hypothetical protein [Ignavibacteria bacterium]
MEKTDINRWLNSNQSWESRIEQMASYIPKDSLVLDIGAGKKILKKFIPTCEHNTLDLQDSTYNCDLNNMTDYLWEGIGIYSHIFCSGVLEYIINLPEFIKHITSKGSTFIISYAGVELNNERKSHRWLNDYRIIDIVTMFLNKNCELIRIQEWQTHTLMVFKKESKNEL